MTTVKYDNREELISAIKKMVERKKEIQKRVIENYVADRKEMGLPVLQ